jgi:lysyl-tRNA synthetase class 2
MLAVRVTSSTAAGRHEAQLIAERREKLARMRAEGIDPYPRRFPDRTFVADVQAAHAELSDEGEHPDLRHRVAGRIAARREHGRVMFLDVVDRSGRLQILVREDALGEEEFRRVAELDVGDIVGVEGCVYVTPRRELTLKAANVTLLSKALRPPPDEQHGVKDPEVRFRQRELDLIASEETREVFLTRARVVHALRAWFNDHGFVEVETPALQPVYGGAAARPFVTHFNALDEDRFLRISPEGYLKRCVLGGLESVYDFGKCFRNEGISPEHNPEFTMLEWIQAYVDTSDSMAFFEEMVAGVAQQVLGTTKIQRGGHEIDLAPPWRRMRLRDSILEATGVDILAADRDELVAAIGEGADPDARRGVLIGKLFSKHVQLNLIQPTFVVDSPTELCLLAKRHPELDGFVDCYEAVVGGIELATAGADNNDPDAQAEALLAYHGEGTEEDPGEPYDEEMIRALELGMQPTVGCGLGVDRLVMILTGADTLREVMLFPALRHQQR